MPAKAPPGAPSAPRATELFEPAFETPHPEDPLPSRSQVVVLESPRDQEGVRATLQSFFRALSEEAPQDLATTLSGGAVSYFADGTRANALTGWMRRFAEHDYRALSGQALPGPGPIETYAAAEVARLSSLRDFPIEPGAGELLAVVPIAPPSADLLGSPMLFVLRPTEDGYEIRATHEDTTRR